MVIPGARHGPCRKAKVDGAFFQVDQLIGGDGMGQAQFDIRMRGLEPL